MIVRECMCCNVSCAKPESTVCEVAKLMLDKHVGCIPVCDNNKNVVGLITDRDLILRCLACDKDSKTPVSEIMTTKVHTVPSDATIADASKKMCDCQVRRIPVVDNNMLVGIITLGDLANNNNVNSQDVSNTVEGICRCGQNAKNNS